MSVIMKWNGDEVKKMAENAAKLSAFELGLVVQGQAKALQLPDTGRLRASITTSSGDGKMTKPSGDGAVGSDIIKKPNNKFETFVGTPVSYGPYVEYGTFRMDARPFLRPALDIVRGRKVTFIDQILKDGTIIKEFGEYLNPKGKMTHEQAFKAQT